MVQGVSSMHVSSRVRTGKISARPEPTGGQTRFLSAAFLKHARTLSLTHTCRSTFLSVSAGQQGIFTKMQTARLHRRQEPALVLVGQ